MNNKKRYEESSIQSSIAITQQFSTSFTLGIFCLKKEIRNPIYGIYGFVRVTDEIVDTFHEQDQSSELDRFEDATKLAIKNQFSTNPVLHSFQAVVNQYHIDNNLCEGAPHLVGGDAHRVDLDGPGGPLRRQRRQLLSTALGRRADRWRAQPPLDHIQLEA